MNTILLYIIVDVFAACNTGPFVYRNGATISKPRPAVIEFTTSKDKAWRKLENRGDVEVYSISVRGVVKKLDFEEVFDKPKIIDKTQTIFVPPPQNRGGK